MGSRTRAWLFGVALTLKSASTFAVDPGESERAEARALGYAGVRTYAAGDFVLASERLERSYAILPVPSLGLWSARALVRLGKLVEAEERYLAVTRLRLDENAAQVHRDAQATAELELQELLPKLPSVSLSILGASPSDVVVTLDGNVWPLVPGRPSRWVNPGPHRVVGSIGAERSEVEFVAKEGARSEVLLRFALSSGGGATALPLDAPHASESRASAWRVIGWTLAAVGAASLGVSAATYVVGRNKYDDLHQDGTCRDERCQPGAAFDAYDRVRGVQTVSFALGLTLAAAGATVLVLDWSSSESGARAGNGVGLLLGMGSAAIRARY